MTPTNDAENDEGGQPGDSNSAQAVAEMKPDLSEGDGGQAGVPAARLVHEIQPGLRQGWQDLPVRQRQVGDRQAGAVVAHDGADDELEVDDEDECRGSSEERAMSSDLRRLRF